MLGSTEAGEEEERSDAAVRAAREKLAVTKAKAALPAKQLAVLRKFPARRWGPQKLQKPHRAS